MVCTLLLATSVLVVSADLAQAQYYYPAAAPGDPGALVNSWYKRFLGRQADPGAAGWVRSLQTGHTPEKVLSTILSSEEYFVRAGRTKPGFVRQLYLDLVGRPPSAAEVNYWMGRLRFESRKDIAYQILTGHPQNWSDLPGPSLPYAPGYYPEPAVATPRDPTGAYFRGPYPYYYEYRRPIGVFPRGP